MTLFCSGTCNVLCSRQQPDQRTTKSPPKGGLEKYLRFNYRKSERDVIIEIIEIAATGRLCRSGSRRRPASTLRST